MKLVGEIVREVVERREVPIISVQDFLKEVNSHKEIKEELINKLIIAVDTCTLVQDIKFDTKILTEAKKSEIPILYKTIKRIIAEQEKEARDYNKMDTNELLREILKKLDKKSKGE